MRDLISNGIKRLVKNKPKYPRGDRDATVISVATVKGGVGKTTTSVNLACGLAKFSDARVLLIDLDAQGHCSTSLSKHREEVDESGDDAEKRPLSEVLLSDDDLQVLDASMPSGVERLDLTPADAGLADADGQLSQKIGKELRLRDALDVTRTHYDFIIIDSPPNKGNLTLNGLLASDSVLIPTDLSPLSVQGADELVGTVMQATQRLDHDLDILGVLLTRVDKRTTSINQDVLDTIDEAWGELVLETRIGINTQISKAQLQGQSIFDYAPRSRGAKHYRQLSEEILARVD